MSQCTPTPSSARVFITRTFYSVSVYSYCLFCSSIHILYLLFCLSVLPLPLLLEYHVLYVLSCLSVLPLPILLEYLCLVRFIPSQCTPTASSARVFMSCTFYPVSMFFHCLFCSSIYVLYVLSPLNVLPLPLLLEYLCLVRSIPSQCSSTASSARVFMSCTFYPVLVFFHCFFCSSLHVL